MKEAITNKRTYILEEFHNTQLKGSFAGNRIKHSYEGTSTLERSEDGIPLLEKGEQSAPFAQAPPNDRRERGSLIFQEGDEVPELELQEQEVSFEVGDESDKESEQESESEPETVSNNRTARETARQKQLQKVRSKKPKLCGGGAKTKEIRKQGVTQ